jgi:cobalamin synthase
MINAFFTALRALTRLPLQGDDSSNNQLVLNMFAPAGLLLGLVLWLVAWFLLMASGPLAAAFVTGVAFGPLYWWVTEGRNPGGVIWCATNWGMAAGTSNDEAAQFRPYWVMLTVQFAFLFRLAATAILVYSGHPLWLAAAPLMGMTAHADLLLSARPADEPGTVPVRVPLVWLVTGVLVIVLGGLAAGLLKTGLLAGLLVLVLAWALTPWGCRWLEARCGGVNEHVHGAIREAVELMTLAVGVLAFAV